MLQKLINLSPDIKKLSEEGYDLEENGAYLLAHHIPYLNVNREVKYGTLVTVLTLSAPDITTRPQDHTVFFCGDLPCEESGVPLHSVIHSSVDQQLSGGILVNHYFSSKPTIGYYDDFYQKIRTYAEILSAHATTIDPLATSRPYKKRRDYEAESIFKYPDINSAKAKIDFLNSKFADQKIAIIGLGGTGSYILDLVSKVPVKEIHLFDDDVFQIHNAFRAPGATDGEKWREKTEWSKVDYYCEIYSHMHKGIVPHKMKVIAQNIGELRGFNTVFIAVDENAVRHFLTNAIIDLGITFIDVGIGVQLINEELIGAARVTTGTPEMNSHLQNRIGQDKIESNEYSQNIQIADLNCLNAVLAVIKWKRILGFYQDLKHEHNTLYFANTGKIVNDDYSI